MNREEGARRIACPVCPAHRGYPCTQPSGRERHAHRQRAIVSDRLYEQAAAFDQQRRENLDEAARILALAVEHGLRALFRSIRQDET